jgi:hypothetical protein
MPGGNAENKENAWFSIASVRDKTQMCHLTQRSNNHSTLTILCIYIHIKVITPYLNLAPVHKLNNQLDISKFHPIDDNNWVLDLMLFKQLLEHNERKISMISVHTSRPSKVQINAVTTQQYM